MRLSYLDGQVYKEWGPDPRFMFKLVYTGLIDKDCIKCINITQYTMLANTATNVIILIWNNTTLSWQLILDQYIPALITTKLSGNVVVSNPNDYINSNNEIYVLTYPIFGEIDFAHDFFELCLNTFCEAPTGATGAMGPTGPAGPTGFQGATGAPCICCECTDFKGITNPSSGSAIYTSMGFPPSGSPTAFIADPGTMEAATIDYNKISYLDGILYRQWPPNPIFLYKLKYTGLIPFNCIEKIEITQYSRVDNTSTNVIVAIWNNFTNTWDNIINQFVIANIITKLEGSIDVVDPEMYINPLDEIYIHTYTVFGDVDFSQDYFRLCLKGCNNCSGITGAQGAEGPQGAQGPQGPQGPTGANYWSPTGPQGRSLMLNNTFNALDIVGDVTVTSGAIYLPSPDNIPANNWRIMTVSGGSLLFQRFDGMTWITRQTFT
jgi:hypothetical protein